MKRGDIIELGNHRLMCGDSTNPDDVKELMCRYEKAELIFTSPPYADLRTYEKCSDLSVEHLAEFIPVWKPYTNYFSVNVGLIRRDYEIVPWWNPYIDSARSAGLKLLAWNVWDRMHPGSIGLQKALFPIEHEWILVFGTEYKTLNKTAMKKDKRAITGSGRYVTRRQADGSTVKKWSQYINTPYKVMGSVNHILYECSTKRTTQHPATFPVKLPASYIECMTSPGDIVADAFGGSGTTLIASEFLGRKCRLMEINPKYCDVIIDRYNSMAEEIEKIKQKWNSVESPKTIKNITLSNYFPNIFENT